jgi:hypothetical protein
MPREFALDSTIVVILAGGHSGEPRAKERAESILLEHEDAGEIVGIPAAAWAECCHCDLDAAFVIWSLNPKAAVIANRLTPPMIAAGKAQGFTRREVKVDALILATAEAEGCTALYTTDGWFSTVAREAGLAIQIRPLPPIRPVQATISEAPQIRHSDEDT